MAFCGRRGHGDHAQKEESRVPNTEVSERRSRTRNATRRRCSAHAPCHGVRRSSQGQHRQGREPVGRQAADHARGAERRVARRAVADAAQHVHALQHDGACAALYDQSAAAAVRRGAGGDLDDGSRPPAGDASHRGARHAREGPRDPHRHRRRGVLLPDRQVARVHVPHRHERKTARPRASLERRSPVII